MNLVEEQRRFYRERVPDQFNQRLIDQAERARRDERDAKALAGMEAVRTAIRIHVVESASGRTHVHELEIDKGRMQVAEGSTRKAFFILTHTLDSFPNLREECGDSVLGFLGALAGLGNEMNLTAQRVRSLRALAGHLDFEVGGDRGFSLRATFGLETTEGPARAAIRIEAEIFDALRSGRLDAQHAFLEEMIEVDGDLEMAVGVALAVLSPD